jgi:hypothetical protein
MPMRDAAPRLGNAGDRAFARAFAQGRARVPRPALAPTAESL